jgi:hypothetical protein
MKIKKYKKLHIRGLFSYGKPIKCMGSTKLKLMNYQHYYGSSLDNAMLVLENKEYELEVIGGKQYPCAWLEEEDAKKLIKCLKLFLKTAKKKCKKGKKQNE